MATTLTPLSGTSMVLRRTHNGDPVDPAQPWHPGGPVVMEMSVTALLRPMIQYLAGTTIATDAVDASVTLSPTAAFTPLPGDELVDVGDIYRVMQAMQDSPTDPRGLYKLLLRR